MGVLVFAGLFIHASQALSTAWSSAEGSPRVPFAFPSAVVCIATAAGHGAITTEIIDAPTFYFAEDYHQQYLHKNPGGYCGLGGTGVACPTGLDV